VWNGTLYHSYCCVCSVVCSLSHCVCSVYCLCVNVHWTTATGISRHFSTTLTEGFPCFFLSCKTNARDNSQRRGTARISKLFFIWYVCSVPILTELLRIRNPYGPNVNQPQKQWLHLSYQRCLVRCRRRVFERDFVLMCAGHIIIIIILDYFPHVYMQDMRFV
jgi:hypothetical protein